MADRHTHAKGLVKDAAERSRRPTYHSELEAMEEQELRVLLVTLMEQSIVVSGAVLEEVSNGSSGHGGLTIIIGRKALAGLSALFVGSGASVLAGLKALL